LVSHGVGDAVKRGTARSCCGAAMLVGPCLAIELRAVPLLDIVDVDASEIAAEPWAHVISVPPTLTDSVTALHLRLRTLKQTEASCSRTIKGRCQLRCLHAERLVFVCNPLERCDGRERRAPRRVRALGGVGLAGAMAGLSILARVVHHRHED
jgi:hypothetical protein